MKIKKDFWDMSWNPCWGCLYGCKFCYARRIARQYAEQIAEKEIKYVCKSLRLDGFFYTKSRNEMLKLKSFTPTWLESNYVHKFPQKPSIIFVNSMSDPAYWEPEWYDKIVKRIAENMQHTFVVLTKQPEVYMRYRFPHNTIIGVSIIRFCDVKKLEGFFAINERENRNKTLISFEPIQEEVDELLFNIIKIYKADWIHVGQESGNRAESIRATREMIEPFFDLDVPVFMKNNLAGICGDKPLRKEFPGWK